MVGPVPFEQLLQLPQGVPIPPPAARTPSDPALGANASLSLAGRPPQTPEADVPPDGGPILRLTQDDDQELLPPDEHLRMLDELMDLDHRLMAVAPAMIAPETPVAGLPGGVRAIEPINLDVAIRARRAARTFELSRGDEAPRARVRSRRQPSDPSGRGRRIDLRV